MELPEVILGPRICNHLAQAVTLFDQRCDLVSLALRFSVISHYSATPAARIVPELQTGDCNKVRAALEQLLEDSPESVELLKLEAKTAGIEPNPKFRLKGGSRKYASSHFKAYCWFLSLTISDVCHQHYELQRR
jgi:hypothetical protein